MPELIDKDYIKNMLLAWGKELSENPNTESDTQLDMIRQFYNSVSDFPTIEAEPVRNGRWIKETEPDENGNVISVCNQCYHTDEHCKNIKVPYCWYCGAYMIAEGASNV